MYCVGVQPFAVHSCDDHRAFRVTVAQLIATGACRPCEIVRAFGVPKRSVLRAAERFRDSGHEGFFVAKQGRRSGTVLTAAVLAQAQQLLDEGVERSAIATRLSVPSETLRKAVADGRLVIRPLPTVATDKSARSVEAAEAADGMGTACTRIAERVLASLGQLDGGAAVRFEPCRDVSFGGVLCAVPSLLNNGLLDRAKGALPPLRGYYTLSHVLMLVSFTALARLRTVEALGRKAPGEFGRLLGLDRCPGVRCLREKLDALSAGDGADKWAAQLSQDWMSKEPQAVGTLYVDGHVRVYHGELTKLPRKYVTRERLCLRGTTDYWVNDAHGRPFFVIERVVDAGLLEVLRTDIVPRLLRDIPNQPSAEELARHKYRCRFTLVFDREGYSPQFMTEMWQQHRIACITYHKYPAAPWPSEQFVEQTFPMPNGETLTMSLAEMGSQVGSAQSTIWVREIRKLTDGGHQVSLIGTNFEVEHTAMAADLFSRWCQENFFRYMKEHFALDLLAEHGTEPLPDTTRVINPAWRSLSNEKQSVQSKLVHRRARFAEFDLREDAQPQTNHEMRVDKKARLLEDIQCHEQLLAQLKAKMKETPHYLQMKDLPPSERFERLSRTRKRVLDTVHMIAYRAETAMVPLLMNDKVDSSQARSILQTLFLCDADIVPDPQHERLLVQVHRSAVPATDRHRQRLFEELNATETCYPGTSLRLVYEMVGEQNAENPQNQPNGATSSSGR